MELTHLQGRGVVWIQEDQVPVVRVRWVQSFQEVRAPDEYRKATGVKPGYLSRLPPLPAVAIFASYMHTHTCMTSSSSQHKACIVFNVQVRVRSVELHLLWATT